MDPEKDCQGRTGILSCQGIISCRWEQHHWVNHSRNAYQESMDLAEDEEEGQEYQEGEGEEGETTTDTGPQGTPLRLAETVKKQKTTNITITNKHQQDLTTFYPTTIQQAYLLSPAVCFIHRTPTSRDESSQKRSWKWYGDAMNDSQSSSGDNLFRRRPSPKVFVKLKEQIGYRKSVSIPVAASASSGLSIGKSSGVFSVATSPPSIRSVSSLCIKTSLEDLRSSSGTGAISSIRTIIGNFKIWTSGLGDTERTSRGSLEGTNGVGVLKEN
ncbi:MAG: hypothetical protein J3Q66DRAFT_401037 [Benniella sp.]|nr:MAG: hypothetical protein J3Q66DRAFT_401037 [Benniella sp.]